MAPACPGEGVVPSTLSPTQQTAEAQRESCRAVTYIHIQPQVSGPGHALQSWRTSPEQSGQKCLQHSAKQHSTTWTLVCKVQLPRHRQLKAHILNSSACCLLAHPTVCAILLLNKALTLSPSKPLAQVALCNILWLSTNCMEKKEVFLLVTKKKKAQKKQQPKPAKINHIPPPPQKNIPNTLTGNEFLFPLKTQK